MHLRLFMKILMVAAAVLAVGLAVATPPDGLARERAAAARKGSGPDFNRDGGGDVAIGSPHGRVAGRSRAGYVTVVDGPGGAADLNRRALLHQGSPGVPGAPEAGDAFGAAVAGGDFDGDGYDDLIVTTPGEDLSGVADAGGFTILYGGRSGPSTARSFVGYLSAGERRAGDRLGEAVAVADFDGDGRDDVVTGTRGRFRMDIWWGRAWRSATAESLDAPTRFGALAAARKPVPAILHPATGDLNGDDFADLAVAWRRTDGSTGTSVYLGSASGLGLIGGDVEYGSALAFSDTDGDGHDDLVVGQSWDGTSVIGGRIKVWHGGKDGLDPTKAVIRLSQDSPGVAGGGEKGDAFGYEVAGGDVNGDGRGDVAVAIPFEDAPGANDVGGVAVLYGGESGLSTARSQRFSQLTRGLPGDGAQANDRFGYGLTLADLNRNGRADLIVGAPGENRWTGSVTALNAVPGGLSLRGAQSWVPARLRLPYGATLGHTFAR